MVKTFKLAGILIIILCLFMSSRFFDRQVYAEDIGETSVTLHEELPIGKGHLKETRTTKRVAPGVTYTKIVRGHEPDKQGYSVEAGFFEKKERAKQITKKLHNSGYEPRITKIKNSRHTDIPEHELGYLVYVGAFDDKQEAAHLAEELKAKGFDQSVVYTPTNGLKTTGPWVVHVLEVDPDKYGGKIDSSLATGEIVGKETISSMADRLNAYAAINGGYFVVGPQDGTPGDLAGVSVQEGKIISESTGNRTSFILPNTTGENAKIASVQTRARITTPDGSSNVMDGFNRAPGLIRSCGGTNGDIPTTEPMHDVTCRDNSELILYSPIFGEKTPEGNGTEVVLNQSGVVTKIRMSRGGIIPENGEVLSATGNTSTWLKEHVHLGDELKIDTSLFINNKKVQPKSTLNIVNGGPRLLKDGEIFITAEKDGFHWSKEFYYRFGMVRHPRTLAGIKENGNLLFITVDGRNPGKSIGVNFIESAKLMKSLGAVDALNLDGGGSTTMTIGSKLVTDPSDATGERPVGDGIFLIP